MTAAEGIAVGDALVAARRLRRRLDGRPSQVRALRRLEAAAQHAAEDGDAAAAWEAIEGWRRAARPLLVETDKRLAGFAPGAVPEKSTGPGR